MKISWHTKVLIFERKSKSKFVWYIAVNNWNNFSVFLLEVQIEHAAGYSFKQKLMTKNMGTILDKFCSYLVLSLLPYGLILHQLNFFTCTV